MPRFTYTHAELTGAAEALAANVHPGTPWEELTEAEKGNCEADAEAVLRAVDGQEAS